MILQPEGPLFFASIINLLNIYNHSSKHEILLINLNHITMIDLSGVYALEDLINNAKNKNIEVFVLNENSKINKILNKLNFIKCIKKDHYIDSNNSIINMILKKYN